MSHKVTDKVCAGLALGQCFAGDNESLGRGFKLAEVRLGVVGLFLEKNVEEQVSVR